MTPNFEIFISEITLLWPDYTTKRITPRTFHIGLYDTTGYGNSFLNLQMNVNGVKSCRIM